MILSTKQPRAMGNKRTYHETPVFANIGGGFPEALWNTHWFANLSLQVLRRLAANDELPSNTFQFERFSKNRMNLIHPLLSYPIGYEGLSPMAPKICYTDFILVLTKYI
ncbi:hypothetical protein AVEN_260756-1 [Araneus ventricosus]|uniref:Uncharacterized protein n=1 Tax=Araneus ventricosus TaxID=182803 RepID=A0A4Y2T5L4_ARAVE|nr:hypothetical protein AVEN_41345-1 [Araneus ventricosus]GBL65818.1 hypothetical protein AVEN_208790-1 [Araneus ventricosus]GBN94786.1 hypothetical protein AVEN_260756-1 [Araneus ventricosus]